MTLTLDSVFDMDLEKCAEKCAKTANYITTIAAYMNLACCTVFVFFLIILQALVTTNLSSFTNSTKEATLLRNFHLLQRQKQQL